MSSIWTGMLFLHGHVTDPALARRLAQAKTTPKPRGKRRLRELRLPPSLASDKAIPCGRPA